MDANAFAPVALVFSVPLTFVMFSIFPPYRAGFLALLSAALLLPVGYGWEVPALKMLDKGNLPVLATVAACLLVAPGEFRKLRLRDPILIPALALVIGPLFTAFNNHDASSVGGGLVLPGLTDWDGFALSLQNAVTFVIPFLLGRMLVREVAQLERLLRALVVAFLAYSIAMLWEVRMSPQLHATVYGYFPHQFAQMVRDGGFRPVVFVGHGLGLAILTSYAVVASAILARRGRRILGQPASWSTAYLCVILALCKTLSAMLYAGSGILVARLLSPKAQLRVAATVACIVLGYPLLRSFDLFPTTLLTTISETVSQERSDSLEFRFENEDQLLAQARKHPIVGWGGYGRSRVFDDEGKDISVVDGLWILLLGQLGAVGFLGVFGLMLLPIFSAARALRNMPSASDRSLLASCAFLVAVNWADSLPNALSGGVLMIFVSGAFSGVVASYRVRRPVKRRVTEVAPIPARPLGPALGR